MEVRRAPARAAGRCGRLRRAYSGPDSRLSRPHHHHNHRPAGHHAQRGTRTLPAENAPRTRTRRGTPERTCAGGRCEKRCEFRCCRLQSDAARCKQIKVFSRGEVPERPKGHAWRACVPTRYRGFESHPLRFFSPAVHWTRACRHANISLHGGIGVSGWWTVVIARSRARGHREPRQVRKEAAVPIASLCRGET